MFLSKGSSQFQLGLRLDDIIPRKNAGALALLRLLLETSVGVTTKINPLNTVWVPTENVGIILFVLCQMSLSVGWYYKVPPTSAQLRQTTYASGTAGCETEKLCFTFRSIWVTNRVI